MPERTYLPTPDRWKAVAVPAGLAMLVIGSLACLLLALSVQQADDLVINRDQRLAASILEQALERIGHDQESVTAWDDAVIHLHGPLDSGWMDDNIGTWMNLYYGHERVAILDPKDRPIYTSFGSERRDPQTFDEIAGLAMPLVANLRRIVNAGTWRSRNPIVRSPGAQDIVVVDGHPAMISVKPIVPSTEKIQQAPANTFLHVTVHYLDGSFLVELRQRYLFENARFSWANTPRPDELSFALRNTRGIPIGYLIWTTHLPGQVLMERLAPALAATLIAILIVVAVLVMSLRRGADALRISEAKARHLAFHDSLTGLPNRAHFNTKLSYACRLGTVGTTLLLLDLDRFKAVNDTFGHPAGDELLRAVCVRLRDTVPEGSTVARLGGDEFAILLEGALPAHLEALGKAIRQAISASFELQTACTRVEIGVSIGIATLAQTTAADNLIKRADEALYRAKRLGCGLCIAGDQDTKPFGDRLAA